MSYLAVLALNCHFWGTWRGQLLMWLMVCVKVWSCNTLPVCWVMGVVDSGLAGSSTVSLRVRPLLGKEGGFRAPKAS